MADRASISLLEVDPDLGQHLPPEALAVATRHAIARTFAFEAGPWDPSPLEDARQGSAIGLYIVSGLMTREIHLAGRGTAELLGPGDLIRPWAQDGDFDELPLETRWSVIEPATIAVLDGQVTTVIGRFPTIVDALVGRFAQRTRSLTFQLALTQVTRVEARLVIALWQLGHRFGRVRPDGLLLGLRLTHETLAKLVGARRPSVTTAMTALQRRGWIERIDAGWLLHGDQVDHLDELTNAQPSVNGAR